MRLVVIVVLAAALLLSAGPALAHVTVSPSEAPAGGNATFTFQVSHGCDGSSTTAIRVQIPEGAEVTPQAHPDWEVTVTDDEVAWRGGPLPDGLMDTFAMRVALPDQAGETLYFPVIQECEQGQIAWTQVPEEGQDPHDLPEPAPAVVLVAGSGQSHEEADATAAPTATPAAAPTGPAESVAEPEPVSATAERSGVDPLALSALVLGVLGVLSGGWALLRTRRT